MLKKRLIAVLILRDGAVVQSVRFKHTNSIHYDPVHAIECFNKWAVDEIVILNVSREAASGEDYARSLLNAGADKLVVNTILADDPALMQALSRRFGQQCMVASIDVKRGADGRPEVVVDRASRGTGQDPAAWAKRAVELGAGEIFVNSVDHDGARRGYDLESLRLVCAAVEVPVVAFGGVFKWEHMVEGIRAGADAVAAANIFHYTEHATMKAKRHLSEAGVPVRTEGQRA